MEKSEKPNNWLEITDILQGASDIIQVSDGIPFWEYLEIPKLPAQGNFHLGSGPSLNRVGWLLLQAHSRRKPSQTWPSLKHSALAMD